MNGDSCPEGVPYGQWLREKNVGVRVKWANHQERDVPASTMRFLQNKPNELWDRNLARQKGKRIDPEDM